MKIVITSMTLTNFKKVRSATYRFNNEVTDVFGANGAGKTTIKDAFLWCLFGKDSTNRKDFEIKPLDENNQPFHNLDHEVEINLLIDGDDVKLKRSMREKWGKRRGDVTTEFKGHETTFMWNDVPCQLNEYQAKVDSLIKEDLFKLVTSTGYFNALDWKVRRNTLMAIAGDITNDQILNNISLNGGSVHPELIAALGKQKTPDQFKAEIAAKKKTIKDELILIPSRIDEANRSIGESVDYSTIEKAKEKAESDLEVVESELLDLTRQVQQQQNAKADKIKQQGGLKLDLQNAEFEIKGRFKDQQQQRLEEIGNMQRSLESKKRELNSLNIEKSNEASKVSTNKINQSNARAKWQEVNKEVLKFNEKEFCCPTCKRELEGVDMEAKKEEFTKNFNADKAKRLEQIQKEGDELGKSIQVLEANINNIQVKIDGLSSEIQLDEQSINSLLTDHQNKLSNESEELQKAINEDSNILSIRTRITDLQNDIDADVAPVDNAAQIEKKQSLRKEIDSYTQQLAGKSQRDAIIRRIDELKLSESEMSQSIADLEGIEFSIEQFTKEKMDELDRRINGRFSIVKFKLFDTQINGGQAECCETLIDGVPFSDANTASKVNAGLDIINTLCDHYGVSAPIFIDNRESVTDIIETESQVINLHVSPADSNIRVLVSELSAAI